MYPNASCKPCKSIGCTNILSATSHEDFCDACREKKLFADDQIPVPDTARMSDLYPKYYKNVEHLEEVDVYMVHHLFNIQDPSGAIQHASKKLLLSGVRTGGKSAYQDIKEARDTLNRWLQINKP